jgi:hypothetical protein
MTQVTAYDIDAKIIDSLAEKNDTTEAEIISAIFEAIHNEEINLADYL